MKIIIGYIFAFNATKMGSWDSGETKVDPHWAQDPPWSFNTPDMALYILDIFVHSMQQKMDKGSLGTERSTLIGCRTRLGPSMDPAMALQYT